MKLRHDKRSGAAAGHRDRNGQSDRVRPSRVEPSTFAWVDPLDDLDPVVVEKIVEKPVVYERQVIVEKVVEKPVLVERIVEKQVDRPLLVEKLFERESAANKRPSLRAALASRIAKPTTADDRPAAKAIIIGRGPSLVERLVNASPNPKPVLAGACALLIALTGVALISPSGEQATAQRSTAPLGVSEAADDSSAANLTGVTDSAGTTIDGEKRDPFAADGFKARTSKKKNAAKSRKADSKKAQAAAPGVAKPSMFAASFVTYSNYSPWLKVKRRSGGWLEFGGEPTVKVVSIGRESVELYVVTDVEVLSDKSKNFSYSYPLRTVRLSPNGVVRFADYRDIQGEDVEYTVRFRGSSPVPTKIAPR